MHQRWREAAAAYERGLALHGAEPDASIMLVSLGQIELEHLGAPKRGLQHFSQYLAVAPNGVLAAEAMAGTAAAQRMLVRTADEVQTLRELIARFPMDANAQIAKKRLDALQHQDR